MGLSQSQRTIVEKALASSGGELGVSLSAGASSFLLATIVFDLDLGEHFPEIPKPAPSLFSSVPPDSLEISGLEFWSIFERLIGIEPNADTYFSCLAALHKSRLKYWRILSHQGIPTMDQVGPRSLLQYGHMADSALAAFLLWRKWLFDIDNRAGQETGYLFEPIIANSIGGYPASSRKSPIKRGRDAGKGRQVDCIRANFAYEIKIRVSIAASGQGRWQEELDFPEDCIVSGYCPVLLVLDPTPNPKLDELIRAFQSAGGKTYVGEAAWKHLEDAAGDTMRIFLEKYVKAPIQSMLTATPAVLPSLTLNMSESAFSVGLFGHEYTFPRAASNHCGTPKANLPDDIDEESPGL